MTQETGWWIGIAVGGSLLMFVATLVAIPIVIVRMPPDYFTAIRRRPSAWQWQHPVVAPLLLVAKNAAGVLLVATGAVMLVTPGQGLLTILIGLTLTNYPGKYRLERWLITRRPVWRSVNWLRHRAGVPPLESPPLS